MVKKYIFGKPFETDAVVAAIEPSAGDVPYGECEADEHFLYSCKLHEQDVVYGLGEANHGINKRGHRYVSRCVDDNLHTEDTLSLYGAHNFIVIDPVTDNCPSIGLFFDYPSDLAFDIGFTCHDLLTVSCRYPDLYLYVIDGDSAYDVVRQFRHIIGRSYIPPKFAFGFGQSRWGYRTMQDFREVVSKHREYHVPLDMVYMDIDYMDQYKDFTVNPEEFPDFKAFVQEMKAQKIHLIPIVDAGIKVEDGYNVYDEGAGSDYFCKTKDGKNFEGGVWPGLTNFPDVLNPKAREWFGGQYKVLLDYGIDGFWNDMNEPAIFYTPDGIRKIFSEVKKLADGGAKDHWFDFAAKVDAVGNNPDDYDMIYHNINGEMVCNNRVHNLYGYNITRAASEAFELLAPGKRILLFSRSSYIGMHRYGGIWTGDSNSWWSHLLLDLKMLPSLNMCGFLYVGSDLGGFGSDTNRDLMLRWLALGVFTPLMRNHSAIHTRKQEFWRFENPQDFAHVISVRYRLIPYLYSEYLKAAYDDDLYFKPLAFVYPQDKIARETEDQLMLGNDIMIAPVYTQNAQGRMVYLPEEMMFVKFVPGGEIVTQVLPAGPHYVDVALNEVPLFIRRGHAIPVADAAECVDDIDYGTIQMVGYENADYEFRNDDESAAVQ